MSRKLSKQESQAHKRALDLVHSDRTLTIDERLFVLSNYHESQAQLNTLAGAFFTPLSLARDFAIEVEGRRVIDLCAGIGTLSYYVSPKVDELTCVELCAEYVEVGRRVVPTANWIHADVFALPAEIGTFDVAFSNPPFGKLEAPAYRGRVRGGEFEYKVIDIASQLARYGVFLLPQTSSPFEFSGCREFREVTRVVYERFRAATGIALTNSCGIDTSGHAWRGVAPKCEIACAEFDARQQAGNRDEPPQLDLLAA